MPALKVETVEMAFLGVGVISVIPTVKWTKLSRMTKYR